MVDCRRVTCGWLSEGTMHWAGSETAPVGPSFIDGVTGSGECAVAEIGKA